MLDINVFKSRLKSGKPDGWYIFSGEEDYLKKYYMRSLSELTVPTDDPFALFNKISFEGADFDFAAAQEAIKSPPMMGEYKLIEWRYADLDALKESEREALEELAALKTEYTYTVFAILTTRDGFDVGTEKRPSKLAARLGKSFDILNFGKSTDSQLLSWLKKHFDAEGITTDLPTLNALLFRAGHSMEVLNEEVAKLCCYVKSKKRSTVTAEDVELVASPTVECDAFALSNAVIEKNMAKAFNALADMKGRRVDPFAVLGMLSKTYSELSTVALLLDEGKGAADIEALMPKLHSFKIKLYIRAAKSTTPKRLAAALAELTRIDASAKSGGLSGYGVIEMFITQNLNL